MKSRLRNNEKLDSAKRHYHNYLKNFDRAFSILWIVVLLGKENRKPKMLWNLLAAWHKALTMWIDLLYHDLLVKLSFTPAQ